MVDRREGAHAFFCLKNTHAELGHLQIKYRPNNRDNSKIISRLQGRRLGNHLASGQASRPFRVRYPSKWVQNHKHLFVLKKILLVEDDPRVCSFINKGLTENGFEVTVAMEGTLGLQLATRGSFDLLILDIMLPNINGLEMCRLIREQDQSVAILFLTAMGSSENVVIGLESGADDYLVKPFKFIELLARIKTLLRRSEKIEEPKRQASELFTFADLVLNNTEKSVFRNGQELSLTSTEFRLLLMFMKSPRKVLSRMEILDEVWGVNFDMGTNVVDVYVNYIRKKLDKHGEQKLIHTVIGMGYVLKEEQ